MYEFWYDYVKPKYGEKGKLCCMDTGSFTIYIKTGDIYRVIAEDVETRFDTSIYEVARALFKRKNTEVIGLMEGELGGKIMKEFPGLGAKAYSYLIDDDSEDKQAKSTKKCVIKRKLKFENYKNCLGTTQLENKISNLLKMKLM